jgi:uncharacterized protein (UPF0333 family)
MEAKSPVVGNKLPIFKPLALLVVVVVLASGVVVVPFVPVLFVVVVFSQAAMNKLLAIVTKLKARETLNFGISSFHSSMLRSLKINY